MNAASIIAFIKKQPVGFACGLISVVCLFLLYYRSDVIDEYQADYDAKSAEAARMLANVRNATNQSEQTAEIQALSKELDSRLVRAGQLAVNLQYFYKLEEQNEVKLVEVRQNNVSANNKAPYFGIPYSVSATGSYRQVMAFLQHLENGKFFCRFVSATFSKNGGDNMTLTLNVDLLGTQ